MTEIAGKPAPIIIAAILGRKDQAALDALRAEHYPPDRNQVPAHLTLFQHLPPSTLDEVKHRLNQATRGQRAPKARAVGLMSLGRGVAVKIESPGLTLIRRELSESLVSVLMPVDAGGWRPHVTIQNKVAPAMSRLVLRALSKDFRPYEVEIEGLAAYFYRNGPWERISRHMFA